MPSEPPLADLAVRDEASPPAARLHHRPLLALERVLPMRLVTGLQATINLWLLPTSLLLGIALGSAGTWVWSAALVSTISLFAITQRVAAYSVLAGPDLRRRLIDEYFQNSPEIFDDRYLPALILGELRSSPDSELQLARADRFLEHRRVGTSSTDEASLAAWAALTRGELEEARAWSRYAYESTPAPFRHPFFLGRILVVQLLADRLAGKTSEVLATLEGPKTHLFGARYDSVVCAALAWSCHRDGDLEASERWRQRARGRVRLEPLLELAARRLAQPSSPEASPLGPVKAPAGGAGIATLDTSDSQVAGWLKNSVRALQVAFFATAVVTYIGGFVWRGYFYGQLFVIPFVWYLLTGQSLWRRPTTRLLTPRGFSPDGLRMTRLVLSSWGFLTLSETLKYLLFARVPTTLAVSTAVLQGLAIALAAYVASAPQVPTIAGTEALPSEPLALPQTE